MKLVFHLAHPAHFHLFKNIILRLSKSNKILISYNAKDVLDELIQNSELKALAVKVESTERVETKFDLLKQFIHKNIGFFSIVRKFKPDLVIGTSIIIVYASKLLGIKSIIVNEDDFDIINKTAAIGYPFATSLLCPSVCRTGKWDYKTIKYNGYHELCYLHPRYFKPDLKVAKKYIPPGEKIFLLRFAKLIAHHDSGINGISDEIAMNIIKLLEPHGRIYISSERSLSAKFEKYRIKINPTDIHHVMAFCDLYIGDSQTMAAECAILGIPFIRFNDFVGRISYLNELENKYELGYGIKSEDEGKLYYKITELLSTEDLLIKWKIKQQIMLNDKIDVCDFMSSLFENYPNTISSKVL